MKRPPVVVIDTTFLWDLYGIARRDDPPPATVIEQKKQEARTRLAGAIKHGGLCFVSYLVIFETANGIAHIQDDKARIGLAKRFADDVHTSQERASPWAITPDGEHLHKLLSPEGLKRQCEDFATDFAEKRLGLVDMFVQREAERLKLKHSVRPVYIWTADVALRNNAPDREPERWELSGA